MTNADVLFDSDFVHTTAVRADDATPNRLHADYDPGWLSLSGVHGGYQTAVAVRAAHAVEAERTVRTVSASFLRRAQPGAVVLDVEVLRRTRTFTSTSIVATQNGRPVMAARTTAIVLVSGHDWTTPPLDQPAPFSDAVEFTPPPQIPHFHQAQVRLDSATIPTSDAPDARIAGYIRPRSGHHVDAAWLAMAGDWFPPSPFRRVPLPIGGVSVDYTVHVHHAVVLDNDQWLSAVFHTPNSTTGLALEHGVLAVGDDVVAETFHTRWTG